ncbi:MAG: hypothetical protein PUC15_07315, partial [Lentisphaeria bacterium]|nr:hypothetical protein [Lentisphaeria bacterium]
MAKLYVNSEWTNITSITISDQSVTVGAAPSNGIGAYKTLANALTNSSNGDTVYIVASGYPGAGASTDNIFRYNTPPKKSITVTTSNAELTGTDPDTSINLGEIDIDNIQLTFSAIKASTQQLKLYNNTAVLLVENGSDLTLSKFSNPSASSDTKPSDGTVIVRDSALTFTDIANNGINCAITLTNSTLTSMESATKINHRPLELDTASKFIVNGSLSGSGTISIVVKDAPVDSTTYTLVETTGGLSSFLSSGTVTLTVFGYEVTDPFTDGYTFGTSTDNIHFVLGTDANSQCLTLTAKVTGAGMPSRDTVWISAEYDGTPGSTVNDHVVSWNAGTSTSVISSTTSQVYFTGGNETSYGDLDLSDTGAAGGVTISEVGTGTVSLGALTTGTGGVAVNGASLSFSGAITNSTALTVGTSGSEPVTGSITAGAVTNSTDSTITVNSGSTLNANGTFSNSGTLDVYGSVANTELGTLSITNVSGGSVSVKSGGSLTANGGVTNSGSITVNGSMSTGTGAVTNNTGSTITVDNGGSLSTGAITNSSNLNVGTSSTATGTLTATSITNNADSTITVNSGSMLNANGTFSNSGAFDVFGTVANTELGTLTITNISGGSISVKSNSSLTANGGLTNSGAITVAGSMSTGTGAVTNNTGSTITVNNGGSLSTGAITNSSTLNVGHSSTGANGGTLTATSITNNAGGSITVKATSSLTATDSVTNSGTFDVYGGMSTGGITNKTGSTITVNSGSMLNASGTFSNSGTLESTGSIYADTVTNSGSFTVEGESPSSVSTFEAASFSNSSSVSVAAFTNADVSIRGTVSNSGKTANDGGMTVLNSTAEVKGKFTNSGALDITNSTVTVGTSGNTSEILYNSGSGNIAFASKGANSSLTVYGELKNAGTLAVTTESDGGTASITVNGKFTNSNTSASPAVLTVDAGSSFSANSFVNNNGEFSFVYKNSGTNVSVGNFNNSGGTIRIDITEYLDNRATMPVATISGFTLSAPADQGTIILVDSNGNPVSDVSYTFNVNREIVLGPQPIFVNAKWTNTGSIPETVTYNGKTYTIGTDALAFGKVQDAIDAASSGTTIVFYTIHNDHDIEDFKFYPQGLVTIDKDLIFETNTQGKAVKFDSIKISEGAEAKFKNGLYSLEDLLDNDGTLDIIDNARFNGDLVKNSADAVILVGSASRLVAASIDSGTIEVRTGFIDTDLKWIERPLAAKIGDNVTLKLGYPKTDHYSPAEQDGVVYETRTIEGKEQSVVFETLHPGDRIYMKKIGDGQYVCCGSEDHYSTSSDPTDSFYFTTEYGGLLLVRDSFDLSDADSNHIYNTAAIYVTQSDISGDTFTAKSQKLEDSDHRVTVSAESGGNPIVYNSFLEAMNSAYIKGHTIGTPESGMIIRLQSGSYTEPDSGSLTLGTNYNLIVEPDRWWDGEQWHYDDVSLTLRGAFSRAETPNLITFYRLKKLELDDWLIGRDSTTGKTSVVNFVDIENLTINTRLKAQGGATIRILNCNVTSDQHFSVTGGTLIIENSNVKLVGATGFGALSTENNWVGSGTVVIRNSVFTLIGSSTGANPVVVNLKINSEFAISGTCTINGIFTNLNEPDGSDTFITFRDAILDENSSIRGDENHDNVGASLRFEGYNILDGTTVEQYGNKSMTVEAGSTVDMSDGASITVGGGVEVSNCGSITLDNASISAGSFTNEGNLTLSNGAEVQLTGEFTNAKNGTLTAGLHSDGTLGITGSINNEGTVYIDLSHTDLPDGEDLYINLAGLSGSGEVVVIGGGGSYEPEDSAHPPRIRLSVPPTKTLYVSREWQDAGVYRKGTNVGSYTYFGYNAFDNNPDNDPDTNRDLTFTADTTKVIYYGGNGEDAFCDLDLSAAENAANQLTITTVGSMASTKMAIEFASALVVDRDAYNDRNISVVVKEGTKVVETKSLFIAKQNGNNGTTARFTDIDFYSANLSADGKYTVSLVDGNTTHELESKWSVTGLAADRDTASMGALTVGGSQTVTLFGATMSLHDRTAAPATASITNNGTLKVGTGEDAVLEIPVAPSDAMRNVSVKIQIGANEEYHTVQAAKGATSITVESNSISPGQQYTVSVTDTKQISASHDAGTGHTVLKVGILKGNGNHESTRSINVTVQNAAGAKYTFTNVQVAGDATEVELDPLVALDNTSGTVTGTVAEQFSVSVDGNGNFILTAKGEHDEQRVSAYVQKTVGDTVYRFDYTFDVAAGAAGEVGRVSTRLTTEGYYYVKSEEPAVTVTATVTDSSISGSVVKAESVTNDGKLIVASQEDFGSLSLTGIQSAEARTAQVTVMDGTFTVGTYDVEIGAGSSAIVVTSSDFLAEKTYTAMVTDTYYTAGSVSGSETAPQLKFALGDVTAPSVLVQVADSASGDLVGTYTATRITEAGDDNGKYTIVSGEFAAETRYTISYYNTVESQETLVARTECVSSASGVSAPRLAFAVEAGAERTITAVVKDGSGSIVGTFDVDVAEGQTTINLVSSEFTGSGYTVSIAGENTYAAVIGNDSKAIADTPRKSAKMVLDVDKNANAGRWIEVVTGDRTYSLFVAKGASKAELDSENFTVGKEYSDVTIKDAYSTSITAGAGESGATLTLTGLSSSDNVIRPAGAIRRTLKATVRDGVAEIGTYTITTIDSEGNAVISDSRLTAGKEYTVELSDDKTVVATAETLAVFDSTGTVVNNDTITVTDAIFNAGTLTNNRDVENSINGTITITNSQLNVTSTLTNSSAVTMDIDSLITAGSIENGGTIKIDATKFNTNTTDMKKVIDLDNTSGTISGTGNLVLDAKPEQFEAGIGILYDSAEHDYWVVAANQTTVYVNEDWATDENGLAHKTGDLVGDKLYYGYNAFSTFTDAYAETLRVNPYTLNGSQQTITTIEVYGPTAKESVKGEKDEQGEELPLFWTDTVANDQSNLNIVVHGGGTAAAEIPFNNGDYGLTLNPAVNRAIVIAEGITIRTTSEEGFDQCSGTVYLNHQRTSGTIALNGTIDSAREIKIYGKTDVSNTGSLKAATLLWINSGASTVTVTGPEGGWTADDPQVSAENIMISSGKLAITDSKVASKGLVFGDGVDADNIILLESTRTDWTLNNIGTQTGAKGTYQFSAGSITVTGNDSNTINNADVDPGEVVIGSGVTLNLTNMSFSALSVTNSGTITVEGTSTLNIGSLDGTILTKAITGESPEDTINPTLKDSSITGASKDTATLSVQNDLLFSGANTLTSVTLDATGQTITNSGSLTVDVNTLISAEDIIVDSNSGSLTIDASAYATGMVKVIDVADSATLKLADINLINEGANVKLLKDMAGDFWVGVVDMSTIYVNNAWTTDDYEIGQAVGDGQYYGYNAFSSFKQALTVAAARTTPTTITVLNDVEEVYDVDLMAYLNGDVSITKNGDFQISLLEDGTGGRKDLCFVPREGKTLSITCPIVMGGNGSRPSGIWLNYGGAGTTSVSALIDAKSFVGVDGVVNIDSNARITATDGDLQFGRLRDTVPTVASVTGTKTDSEPDPEPDSEQQLQLHGGDYQVDVRGMQLSEGTMTVKDTKIKAGTLSVTDTENLDAGYSGVVVMGATNTTWDLGDMRVLFYTNENKIAQSASSTLKFTKSVINIGSVLKNVPYQTTDGHNEGEELRSSLAMTINLLGSVLNVGTENNSQTGTITNAGTITMDVSDDGTASELYANTITNSGTITMDNNSILIANSITNNGTFAVTNSTLTAPELLNSTGSYYENRGMLTLDGSTFKYKFVDNLSAGEIEITDSTFTVTNTLNNEGTITLMEGSSDDNQNVSTLNVTGMAEKSKAILVNNYVTLKDSTVGSVYGTVKVQENATLTLDGTNSFTTLDLSGASVGVSMDWQDRLSFTGFGSSYAKKFTIDMSGYSYSSVGYLLLDSANNDWTEKMYQELLTNEWNPASASYKFVVKNGDLYAMDHFIVATVDANNGNDDEAKANPNNSNYDFGTIDGATSVIPDKIVVKDGTYGDITQMNGIKTTIQKDTQFTRGVYGGIKATSGEGESSSPVNRDIDLSIEGGVFDKIVVGGNNI